MKKSLQKAIPLIRQALTIISQDEWADSVKILLRRALTEAENIEKKNIKKINQATKYAEDAKKLNDEWWKKIKENAAKFYSEEENKKDE